MPLSNYIAICNALVDLMDPLVETVIHDIHKQSIVHIKGRLSNRRKGDASLIEVDTATDIQVTPYTKINFDGRLIKSISVPLNDQYLLCINCDISLFSQMEQLSKKLLNTKSKKQPSQLFVNDWQEKLHINIHTYLEKNHMTFNQLTQGNKKKIIQYLFEEGAFHEKNAANYIAKTLKIGRATIFNYLKQLRNI